MTTTLCPTPSGRPRTSGRHHLRVETVEGDHCYLPRTLRCCEDRDWPLCALVHGVELPVVPGKPILVDALPAACRRSACPR